MAQKEIGVVGCPGIRNKISDPLAINGFIKNKALRR
jgi:hypothetical protein